MSTPVPYKYWYLLSFLVQQPGVWAPHSTVVGSDTQDLSIPKLNALKEAHGVPAASVLLSVSYLGWMSENGVNGKPDIDEPTAVSEAFRKGMAAAAKPLGPSEAQPVNPYNVVSGDARETANAAEWQAGFAEVRRAQAEHQTPPTQVAPTPTNEPAERLVKPTKQAQTKQE